MLNIGKVQVICEKYPINTIYLFGSFVDGSYDEDSDIDLAYLSAGVDNALDYGCLYFDLQGVFERQIDLVDLRRVPLTLAYGIIKDGRVLYDLDEEGRTDFEDEIIMKYLDFSTFSRLMQAEIDANFGVEVNP